MKKMAILASKVHQFLEADYADYAGYLEDCEDPTLTKKEFLHLTKCDLKCVLASSEMSENHLGGDDLCAMASDVLATVKEGFEVMVWYGPKSEALVVGYRPNQVKILTPAELPN